ncbi:hypothetical protein FISHEDRAFT_50619 [Fistulina hepatica ATCC 64428]|uniref:Uncharacterized protein n=1 Tax=Fistulina hepatica ATCC 64428 TaxID=1128425 RepID=A0A0D7A170_9AGAR|nr:hypothetical protein FISHEDRAFT_50619 [Fistulina hepatica ATCC 64428]
MSNREYSLLLSFLHEKAPHVELGTLQSALSFHLAHLSPTPTPLAASAVSSKYFASVSYTHERLQALSLAFRHAIHLRYRKESTEGSTLLTPSIASRLGSWLLAVLHGLQGGAPVLRLACCTGLLLGIEDIRVEADIQARHRSKVEHDVVLSIAEVMDMYSLVYNSAEPSEVESLSFSLILASQSLPLVPHDKLLALPLRDLARLLLLVVSTAFQRGQLLSSLNVSAAYTTDGAVHTRVITMLYVCQVMKVLRAMAGQVEQDWVDGPLSVDGVQIAPESQKLVASMWTILKTMLFAILMISDTVMTKVVYLPPGPLHVTLATTTLDALSHLSFVISHLGGVTSASGFVELKKTFYMALDVLASDTMQSDVFARRIISSRRGMNYTNRATLLHAKQAYVFSCIEQLIPVLSGGMIEEQVLPFCSQYINAPSHRESYESAHSVMLAIFSRAGAESTRGDTTAQSLASSPVDFAFVRQLVPFYAGCLIENSAADRLNATQLKLAYAALTRRAGTLWSSSAPSSPVEADNDALAWYCIELLVAAIVRYTGADPARAHRLSLALVACVPSLSLRLLPMALAEIQKIIESCGIDREAQRTELVGSLFKEILDNVGEREKAFTLEWWYASRFQASPAAEGSVSSHPVPVESKPSPAPRL